MINIQNVQDFACQCLNRDVWSNDAVRTIIREHFIFWQVSTLFLSLPVNLSPPPPLMLPSLFTQLLFTCSLTCSMLSLQVYHDSEEGQRYIQFYKLNKFPYISILDPRTGECFKGATAAVDGSVICHGHTSGSQQKL